ncbi:SpoIID/LytB domain-containing protein [Metabacillus litoralis]|uniref:SpoIID/LytB domain-containing protein n=1 Tax=Metabacillus litoralis TaxID=152268 RepID=A0A5C6W1L4_9BACI|nr:SpoIID/LytB domain-containing protein [Metabacillus litoralis]
MKRIILFLLFVSIFTSQETVYANDILKVKLKNYIGDTDELTIEVKGRYTTLNGIEEIREGVKHILSVKKGSMLLTNHDDKMVLSESFILIPDHYNKEHVITINDKKYLGAMEFIIEDDKYIRPINHIFLEDYLKGVVPFEVFPSWKIETLKAQSLAARTYTVTHMDKEMDDTIQFQVYGGYEWFEQASRAVDETKGEIITFENKPINAYYSASNGGVTENNENVWNETAKSYFPIKIDPYDPIQPWTLRLHKEQLLLARIDATRMNWWNKLEEKEQSIIEPMKKRLNKQGFEGDIKILSISNLDISPDLFESNRSKKGSIKIEFLRCLIEGTILYEVFELNGVEIDQIRPLIGGSTFRSYFIDTFEEHDRYYVIRGRGFGHGVGMSQWGASIMGDRGYKYKEIIEHYYPGTTIKKISTINKQVHDDES